VRGAWLTTLAIAAWTATSPAISLAQDDDFSPRGDAWNSVSELVRLAEARGIDVRTPDRLDAGELQPSDSLLILDPREPLPTSPITAFLRAGGRVALADDFGAGDSLLAVFRIDRGEPQPEGVLALRGNPALLVARPRGTHRLTQGVGALVSNHPAMVYHRELSPLFELDDNEALVLAGAVGEGRLVVIADASVLIDNMLELRGNRRFAENLVAYLDDERGGRLFVIAPEARVVGRYGEPGADRPLHDLRTTLSNIAKLDVPPLAIQIASVALAAIAFILALGALPRRSPYRAERMFARAPAQGGFVGRVRFFGRRNVNLLQPLMVYKFELEEEILQRLRLSGRALLRDVLAAMRAKGLPEEDVNEMRKLLLELDRLRDLQDRPPAPPRVGKKRFRELIARGERLLERMRENVSAA
jgi:hypothetical protein